MEEPRRIQTSLSKKYLRFGFANIIPKMELLERALGEWVEGLACLYAVPNLSI